MGIDKNEFHKNKKIKEAKILYQLPESDYVVNFVDCFFAESKEFKKGLGHRPFSNMSDYANTNLSDMIMNANYRKNRAQKSITWVILFIIDPHFIHVFVFFYVYNMDYILLIWKAYFFLELFKIIKSIILTFIS